MRRLVSGWTAIRLVTLLAYLFLFGPIVVVVLLSFNPQEFGSFPIRGVTLRWYVQLAENEQIRDAVRTSFLLGGATTVISTSIGLAAALALVRHQFPGKQIIATLLVHLDRSKASEVLEKLTARLRHDVIVRVATFGGVQPAALAELTDVLSDMLSGEGLKRSRLGGVRTAAEIVNLMSTTQEQEAIAHVRAQDEALAQRIVDEMARFA